MAGIVPEIVTSVNEQVTTQVTQRERQLEIEIEKQQTFGKKLVLVLTKYIDLKK